MRLVLDTNVLVAAFVARGACHDLLEHCLVHHDVVMSDFLFEEFERVLSRKLRIPAELVNDARRLLQSETRFVKPAALSAGVCRDPDDDMVLATARAGRCGCVVTGDDDLLVLGAYEGIRILRPVAFWEYERDVVTTPDRES